MKVLVSVLVLLLLPPAAAAADCVVLLHGLLRSESSMSSLEQALGEAGYAVANIGYPSRGDELTALAEAALSRGLRACREQEAGTVHVVTHSMGGILLRSYLRAHEVPDLGRVVMLGPPNQGTEAVDKLEGVPGFAWLVGPAGSQLGTGDGDLPARLPPVDFELGVIAGSSVFNPLLSLLVPNPDDGTVSVASTRVEGMCAFVLMPVTHFWMMHNEQVIEQTLHFLTTGRFDYATAENGLCGDSASMPE